MPDGAAIARVIGGSTSVESVREAFLLSTEHTMEQDQKFALRLLVDVAIKALSPAINDPTTPCRHSTRSRISCAASGSDGLTWVGSSVLAGIRG